MNCRNTSKTHHKGSVWSHHGKVKRRVILCIEHNRRAMSAKRLREQWNAIIERTLADHRRNP